MHNWGASKARLMSGLSAQLQLLDLACHTHSNQPCKNYRLHWFLVFICECAYSGLCVSITVSASLDRNIGRVCVCVRVLRNCTQTCLFCKNRVQTRCVQICEWAPQSVLTGAVRSCTGTRRPHYHQIRLSYCDNQQHTLIFNSALCSNIKKKFFKGSIYMNKCVWEEPLKAWMFMFARCCWAAMASLVLGHKYKHITAITADWEDDKNTFSSCLLP